MHSVLQACARGEAWGPRRHETRRNGRRALPVKYAVWPPPTKTPLLGRGCLENWKLDVSRQAAEPWYLLRATKPISPRPASIIA